MIRESQKKWDIARLELFATVAELGSLSKVAATHGAKQSVISRQIASLERDCGGRLFARTGRGMVLTELGLRLLPIVHGLLAEARHLSEEVDIAGGAITGMVRLGALPSLHLRLIFPLFQAVHATLPAVRLRIFEGSGGQIDDWITDGVIDIGMTYRYHDDLPDDAEPLLKADSHLIGPKGDRLTASPTVDFSKLNGLPIVLSGAPSVIRMTLDQMAKRMGFRLNIILEADSIQIQKDVAMSHYGYTILPRHAALAEIETGTLQASRIVNPDIAATLLLRTTSAHPTSQASRRVAVLLRELAQRHLGAPSNLIAHSGTEEPTKSS